MRNDATIGPSGFNPHQGTISVFWDRLISTNQTLLLTKRPEDNGIAQIQAKDARDYHPIPLDVKLDPNELSAAHSIICDQEYENFDRLGKQDLNEIKMYLARLFCDLIWSDVIGLIEGGSTINCEMVLFIIKW